MGVAVDRMHHKEKSLSAQENERLREELADLQRIASMQESMQHELIRRKAPKVAKAAEKRPMENERQLAVQAGLRAFDAVLLEQKLRMCDLMRGMLEDSSFEGNPSDAP